MDVRAPKVEVNCGIVVREPMLPVSRPKSRPPILMVQEARMYFEGNLRGDFQAMVRCGINAWRGRARFSV